MEEKIKKKYLCSKNLCRKRAKKNICPQKMYSVKNKSSNSLGIKSLPIFSLFIYFLLMILMEDIKCNDYISEINLTVVGKGTQSILSSHTGSCDYIDGGFDSLPNQILVNGIPQSNIGKSVNNLVNQTNIITMRWNYQVTNCNLMFYDLNNIIYIDLSNFDTSKVETFNCMFSSNSLKSINLNNVNTSSAKRMHSMFYECSVLETLNLSSFDTSKVTSMWNMFYGCTSIKSLDLSNFDTSELNYTRGMFYSCSSLLFLNLQKFDAKKATKSGYYEDMFYGVTNLIYCADETEMNNNIKDQLKGFRNNCSQFCFLNSNSKYITEKKECIDQCYNDDIYLYEYNNKCYNSCPKGTHISHKNNFICEEDIICTKYYNYDKTDCLEEIPEGYI